MVVIFAHFRTVLFFPVSFGRSGSCTQTQANVNCVPVIIKSDLYYLGAAPVQFGGKLRQALLSANFSIDGLLSVGDLQVQQSAGGTPGKATSVGSPTPAPGSNRGTPTPVAVSGIQGTTPNNGGSQANAGAFVAASVAALTLVLVALFVVRRHRNNMSDSVGSKHRELTDDEGDLENETDDISGISPPRSTPRKAYVVSDASLDESWNSNYVRSPTVEIGQEVYLPTQNRNSQAMMQPRNYLLEPHHECASPDCPTCGMARQYGTTTFIPTDDSEAHTHDMPVRNYSAKDTVDL